jgi:hypothetical protein
MPGGAPTAHEVFSECMGPVFEYADMLQCSFIAWRGSVAFLRFSRPPPNQDGQRKQGWQTTRLLQALPLFPIARPSDLWVS